MNICFNGDFFPLHQPVFNAQNRSFKYGDGLFETMKFHNGKLLLGELHFERLFTSLLLLQIEKAALFTEENLRHQIVELCKQNNCIGSARIRLAVYRNEWNKADYVIEATPFNQSLNDWQAGGISVCLYPYARKAADAFANIKSANFLPYVLAQKYAQDNNFSDAIVLNAENHLCDSSKANIFLISEGELFTPALHQGCINGIMRRVVINEAKNLGYRVHQADVSEDSLLGADEVFLTNAIQIIRWVRSYREKEYGCELTKEIFHRVSATIFQSFV